MKKELKKAIESNNLKVYGDLVMINNVLFPLPLVQGNEKLGNSVWHSSTLPTNKTITAKLKDGTELSELGTCPFTCKGCYGERNNYNYNTTKYWLIMRTRLLRNYPEIYFLLIDLQIQYERIEKLRIHAVGDFLPGEALGFYEILKKYPNVKSWTYTKLSVSGDIAILDSLKNCNVVKSVIPGFGFNFGKVAYIANLYYYLKRNNKSVYICRCGIDKEQHCSNCSGCSDHEFVLFIEHSTGYKAINDYGYNKIVDLIESQKNENGEK